MITKNVDILVVGAGPVGLMCTYLAHFCGMTVLACDRTSKPIEVGRADALNARTLQLLELVDLFHVLYPLGKTCNTSSIFQDGKFVSRQSTWWTALEGCFHKHFLMLGQAYVEQCLNEKAQPYVLRETDVKDVVVEKSSCTVWLSNGDVVKAKYIIGADGSRSFVREFFNIPFHLIRPKIIWAVIDGVIDSDFPKVPEIIVFQNETSDVAWIPRERNIDRFYIRMDKTEFSQDEVLSKINQSIAPYTLRFKTVEWFSQFNVKEAIAEHFCVHDRVFLAGDACHVHAMNGGQGLNTGLADAFNLIWKINMVLKHDFNKMLLSSYEIERKKVASSVVSSSGELLRATKYSITGTHTRDYVDLIEKRAGNITGMGIRYGKEGLIGQRVFDFELHDVDKTIRLYSLLKYGEYTLLLVSSCQLSVKIPHFVRYLFVDNQEKNNRYWSTSCIYKDTILLIRPDAYIAWFQPIDKKTKNIDLTFFFDRAYLN